MSKTAIVGSGFIGRAWAISFARAGHDVGCGTRRPTATRGARDYIAGVLGDLAANDLLQRPDAGDGARPHRASAELRGGARRRRPRAGEHAGESATSSARSSRGSTPLRRRSAVIASSTSALLPSTFTEHLPGRHRCLVVHPINPPYLIPAAEVVPAPWTTAETVERTRAFLVSAGHAPLVMKRELDGFIMNRLQGALLEEAFRLVADGYASVEDVDIGIRDGLALRWSFMGPFETIDLNAPGGVRDYVERYQGIYSNIFPQMQRRVDWAGAVMETVEADRREAAAARQACANARSGATAG